MIDSIRMIIKIPKACTHQLAWMSGQQMAKTSSFQRLNRALHSNQVTKSWWSFLNIEKDFSKLPLKIKDLKQPILDYKSIQTFSKIHCKRTTNSITRQTWVASSMFWTTILTQQVLKISPHSHSNQFVF